jgi:hypothetical protein
MEGRQSRPPCRRFNDHSRRFDTLLNLLTRLQVWLPAWVEQHASIGVFLDKDNWNADRRRGALKPDRHRTMSLGSGPIKFVARSLAA